MGYYPTENSTEPSFINNHLQLQYLSLVPADTYSGMAHFLSGWSSTFSAAAIQEHWLGNFVLNLVGYGLIILPAALLIRRWKSSTSVKAG